MIKTNWVSPRQVRTDPDTGREVWQLTDGPCECVAPYMYHPAWTADERFVVFGCNRTGRWQPYRVEVATGEITRLYDSEFDVINVQVAPIQGEAFFADGPKLMAVNVETLKARVAVDWSVALDEKAAKAQCVLSSDGAETLVRTSEGNTTVFHFAPTDGSNTCVALQVDTLKCLPGHDQFCPGHGNNTITVNAKIDRSGPPEGKVNYDWFSDDPVARVKTWRIDRDTGEVKPLIFLPKGYSATHCVWNRTGRRMHFHRKTRPDWVPTALCSVNRDGEDIQVHYETDQHKLGHSCVSPDEQWIVTDSQDPNENILLLVHRDRDEEHLLCRPNTSIGSDRPDTRPVGLPPVLPPQRHTHPGFSPTGRFIHYTSDVTGRCQVYAVPVDDLVGESGIPGENAEPRI